MLLFYFTFDEFKSLNGIHYFKIPYRPRLIPWKLSNKRIYRTIPFFLFFHFLKNNFLQKSGGGLKPPAPLWRDFSSAEGTLLPTFRRRHRTTIWLAGAIAPQPFCNNRFEFFLETSLSRKFGKFTLGGFK